MAKVYVTWEDVTEFVNAVSEKYADEHFCGVYGFPRGGLVIAIMLSHKLNIPLLSAPSKGCLIVDDICDSGETLLHYTKNSSKSDDHEFTTCTMYYKRNSLKVVPDFYKMRKGKNWIVFPWEL